MPNAKLLLVSKDRDVVAVFQQRLSSLGYQIAGIASSGEQALQLSNQLHLDLVLMDVHLTGGIDGIVASEMIHTRFDLPVVFLASLSGETTIRRARMTGPFGYLFQPYDEKQLYATIEIALMRHGLEKRIRQSERWLSTILSSIADGVIAVDQQGKVQFMNPVAESLTGWEQDAAIGRALSDVFQIVDETSYKLVDIGLRDSQSSIRYKTDYQAILITSKGTEIPIETSITPIQDEAQVMNGMVLAFRDITGRRQALKEIQRQASHAEALVDVAAQINSRLNLKEVLITVCEVTNRVFTSTLAAAFLYHPEREIFREMAIVRSVPADMPGLESAIELPAHLVADYLSEELPVVAIQDLQGFPDLPYMELIRQQNINSMIIAGYFRQGRIFGLLVALFSEKQRSISEDDISLFKGLADQASIAVANANLFEQVRNGRERQQALSRRLMEVQEQEKRALARELHDQVGQMLTGLQFTLSGIKMRASEEQQEKIKGAQEQISTLISQIREMAIELRPSLLDDLGLLATLTWHIDRYTAQTGIQVDFQISGLEERLRAELETAGYRIIQEALTNVARYAHVKQVQVRVAFDQQVLQIEVIDQGAGFDPTVQLAGKQTVGLSGMRERASLLGGFTEVVSAPGAGTHILARLPLTGWIERRQREHNRTAGR